MDDDAVLLSLKDDNDEEDTFRLSFLFLHRDSIVVNELMG